jgi:hypothetical protein
MDSMSFHRKQVDKLLTSSPLKKDMLEYLWCHIVPWEEGMSHYTFLINWKDPSQGWNCNILIYCLQCMAIRWLPPYMCNLSPIELT